MSGLPAWAWVGIGLVAGAALFVAALPWIIGPLTRLVLSARYGFRIVGAEHVPTRGAALLAANHVSWIDGFILAAACPRRGKALINATYINWPVFRQVAGRAGLIPVPASGPRAQRGAIEAVRGALDRGEVVAIFPEAQLSRTAMLGSFYRGIEVIMKGREAIPVVPVYLENVWGSIFSFSGGRFFAGRPRGWRRTIVVAFGPPVPPPATAASVRLAVQAESVRAVAARSTPPTRPEAIDLTLPHLDHPELGLLAASTPDYDEGGIRQVGQKPGTLGQAPPGVALRVVDDAGLPLPPDAEGRLQALVVGRAGWVDTGQRGRLDRDGFVQVVT